MTPSIARFLSIGQAYNPNLMSEGRSLVFLSTLTGIPQVWRVEVPDAEGASLWPDQLTFGTDRVQGVWLAPSVEQKLVYARDAGGNENAQLFLLDLATGEEVALTEPFGGAMHMFGTWSREGDRFLFAANRRDKARFDLYQQRPDGPAELIWHNDAPGYLQEPRFSPDLRRVALSRVQSSMSSELFEVDLASSSARSLTSGKARYTVVDYTDEGRALLVRTDSNTNFLYLARLD